jgi:hypothetical protein
MDNGDIRISGPTNVPVENQPQNDLKARAGGVMSSAVDEAKRLTSTTRERLMRNADEKKQTVAERLDDYARRVEENVNRGGDEEGLERQVMDAAAQTLRSVARSLSDHSTEEMIDIAGRKIRERPGLFLAGCVALGFLGARLLRR